MSHIVTHILRQCPVYSRCNASLPASTRKGQSLAVIGHEPHEGCAGEILGIVAIADTLHPEVTEALRRSHAAEIEKVIMLSGDNQLTASAIAKQAGIDEAVGDLMPEQQVEHVRKLVTQYTHVGIIGDGVNDAPALAVATVGFAILTDTGATLLVMLNSLRLLEKSDSP